MSATTAFFTVRAPVRVSVAQRPAQVRARALRAPRRPLATPLSMMTMTITIARALLADDAHASPPPHSLPPPRSQAKRSAQVCRAAAKEESKPEERVCPLVCDALERADGVATTEMAKAKCVHPDRPVAKACKDCPRK